MPVRSPSEIPTLDGSAITDGTTTGPFNMTTPPFGPTVAYWADALVQTVRINIEKMRIAKLKADWILRIMETPQLRGKATQLCWNVLPGAGMPPD